MRTNLKKTLKYYEITNFFEIQHIIKDFCCGFPILTPSGMASGPQFRGWDEDAEKVAPFSSPAATPQEVEEV